MTDGSLLVIARDDDPSLPALQRQAGRRLVHARIADLAHAGWRYVSGRPDEATAYADGRIVFARQCAAVLCRIPAVISTDLPHLHADDRVYAGAECTAFLRAWLAQFEGVLCNEPTWMSLAGPEWDPLHWIWHVARLGIPVTTRVGSRCATALVAGGKIFGVVDPTLVAYARRIATAFRSRVLAIRFTNDGEWKFQSADPYPTLDTENAAALLENVLPSRERSARPSMLKEAAVWAAG